jgi:hypothetical protein
MSSVPKAGNELIEIDVEKSGEDDGAVMVDNIPEFDEKTG